MLTLLPVCFHFVYLCLLHFKKVNTCKPHCMAGTQSYERLHNLWNVANLLFPLYIKINQHLHHYHSNVFSAHGNDLARR